MFVDREGKQRTRIRAGDYACFYLARGTLAFSRKRSESGDDRLWWDNGDDQRLVVEPPPLDKFTATYIMIAICQTHHLDWKLVYRRDDGEPKLIFEIREMK